VTKTLYEVLEVAQTASPETIQAAYRSLMTKYHPDKVAGLGVEFKKIADERTKEINSAYDILRDPARRAAYDRQLRDGKPESPPKQETERKQAQEENGTNSSRSRVIGLSAIALVIGLVVAVWMNSRSSVLPVTTPAPTPRPVIQAPPPSPPVTPPAPTPPGAALPVTPPQAFHPGPVIQDCETCPVMVVVPAGSFQMGTDPQSWYHSDDDEHPQHHVTIPAAFAIGKYPVTQAEYYQIMFNNPSNFAGDTRPVETVSWDDAREFVKRLSARTHQSYRLPSEAEWEYAARAGSTTAWSFGDDVTKLPLYAWFADNSGQQTHPVGQKLPNALGLFDMHGNVWEWVEDCYQENYQGAPTNGNAVATGDCASRVLRGGSWDFSPYSLRSANRGRNAPDDRDIDNGFRVARTITP
jgi:formylglycine-generating enzyme required for sulfatase activity